MAWPTRPLHVITSVDYYQHGQRGHGKYLHSHLLFGSIESSGLFDPQIRVHYDINRMMVRDKETPFLGDCTLVEHCRHHPVDLFVYQLSSEDISNPSRRTLEWIHSRGVPIVAFRLDPDGDLVRELIDAKFPMVDLNCMISGFDARPYTQHPERYWLCWSPQDERLAQNPHDTRTVPVSFAGSPRSAEDTPDSDRRTQTVQALIDRGVDVEMLDRSHGVSPITEYFALLQRSKITLNFTVNQLKGRVIEALLCGALLMEPAQSPAALFFQPEHDYVPFDGVDDLEHKVRYYLAHDEERERIAEHGWTTAKTRYSAHVFWATALSLLRQRFPRWAERC